MDRKTGSMRALWTFFALTLGLTYQVFYSLLLNILLFSLYHFSPHGRTLGGS
jgi:hypothetical protein